jgi:hypothetical protein
MEQPFADRVKDLALRLCHNAGRRHLNVSLVDRRLQGVHHGSDYDAVSAVKHQRTVALAEDMNAAADEIVKIRSRAQQEKRDPAALRAEELKIREKFGLLEDTPLWDVTTRGSPRL